MPQPLPLRSVVWVVVLSLTTSLAGCVTIPYKPASETTHDLSQVANPELVRLSVGPRNYLEELAGDVLKQDTRLQQVDGQRFIDAASPERELTLARLLDPSTQPLIEPLQVDYLVVFGQPEDAEIGSVGGFIPFAGIGGNEVSTSVWAAVIDLRQLRLVEQLRSKSVAKSAGVIYGFYGVIIQGDTSNSAKRAVARRVAETIAAATPTGTVRVVFLANEPIPSPEEVIAAEAAKPLPPLPERSLLEGSPEFEAAAAPTAGEGLVYFYCPDKFFSCNGMPLETRIGASEENVAITYLWNAGYFPFYAPTGTMVVRLAIDSEQSVTLDVKSGETYFVKGWTSPGWSQPHGRLAVVDRDEGPREVKKCKRLPSAADADRETRKLAEQGYFDRQLELATLYSTGINYPDGQTLPQDDIEAYKWFTIAPEWRSKSPLSVSSIYYLARAAKVKEALLARMDAAQIAEAQSRAGDWVPTQSPDLPPP